jgi:hypothetical protein
VSYVGFAGQDKENELLTGLRKELKCGTKLVETGAGYELRTRLRDLSYEFDSTARIEKAKIESAVRAAALTVFDCASVKLKFLPTESTKSPRKSSEKKGKK